jgi:hypothetical protein
MDALKQMGVAYGRLGLSTDVSTIDARARGIKAASAAIKISEVPNLIKCAYGFKTTATLAEFIDFFNKEDPTCALLAHDREASLLAATLLVYEMERERKLSGQIALAVVSASLGNMRKPQTDISLFSAADNALAKLQSKSAQVPEDFKYTKHPDSLNTEVDKIEGLAGQPNATVMNGPLVESLRQLGAYAESSALTAARNDNAILGYIRKLEEETRIQWWVMGGWDNDANQPYRAMSLTEAAIRAGNALADKHISPLGMFAAPALLDKVLTTGRTDHDGKLPLRDIAIGSDRAWRNEVFGPIADSPLSSLLPVSAALGLSASSDDAPDWEPRFERITQVSADVLLTPLESALQVYRERLTLRLFSS